MKFIYPDGNIGPHLNQILALACHIPFYSLSHVDWILANPEVVDMLYYDEGEARGLILLHRREEPGFNDERFIFEGVALNGASKVMLPHVRFGLRLKLSRNPDVSCIQADTFPDNKPCRVMLNILGFKRQDYMNEHGQLVYLLER